VNKNNSAYLNSLKNVRIEECRKEKRITEERHSQGNTRHSHYLIPTRSVDEQSAIVEEEEELEILAEMLHFPSCWKLYTALEKQWRK
tara:strand:- start:987 stop:1247 length:261 start_codon:yes stop_codon:yes gene_type:complete